ncbi:putative hydroxylase domain protein [Pseudarthrobacter siccitolerans]|uniref:Putative hydroxylase domain protein n=1 Tax=Pseudarthrobacter siccitolerans TaxID=861266 RepID=A0A024GZX5_9MICC|nr:hypothetical protein [Pseudarthrobacter siccitolerans]CCQ45016.1 putative hydroxylase domain protein [Pseudarthrobacter siccitolerans]
MDAVINSGRATFETAAAFAVSWWMVRAALTKACLLTLPGADGLGRGCCAFDEHRFRSVPYFGDAQS